MVWYPFSNRAAFSELSEKDTNTLGKTELVRIGNTKGGTLTEEKRRGDKRRVSVRWEPVEGEGI